MITRLLMIVFWFLLLAALVTACEAEVTIPVDPSPVVVTATPDAPDPTPTREPSNPHADCAHDAEDVLDCRVSPLHTLDVGEEGYRAETALTLDDRPFMTICGVDEDNALCYSIDYELGSTNNIPFVYCQEQHEGCQFEIHYWAGSAGYCQMLPVVYPDQPYLVKVSYTWDLSEAPGQGIEVYGRVRTSDYQDVILPSQSLSPNGETVWAISTNDTQAAMHICVGFRTPWASFGPHSKVTMSGFGVYALPLDFGGSVIRY